MPTREVDFLIVGQGLAGSLLAFELIARGRTVLVLDDSHHGCSSQVAAGIINPVTGHRLNLTEGFVEYLSHAKRLYKAIEQSLNSQFYQPIKQFRAIKNPGQASYCAKRLAQIDYQAFLKIENSCNFNAAQYGAVEVLETSVVDTKELLSSLKRWLIENQSYRQSCLNYQALRFHSDSVELENVVATKVIFCEGYQAINNPWLKELPFKLSKGEVLSIRSDKKLDSMLSWGNWFLPLVDGNAKLGSNYAWNDLDLQPSEQIKEKLLDSLYSATSIKASVTNHEVGIRPTTKHRHAFVGPISALENAYCFNGFGSKGCLTIPKHAFDLCNHLLESTSLPSEVCKWL